MTTYKKILALGIKFIEKWRREEGGLESLLNQWMFDKLQRFSVPLMMIMDYKLLAND